MSTIELIEIADALGFFQYIVDCFFCFTDCRYDKFIHMIKVASDQYGYYDEDYIFCLRSKSVTANSIDKKLYNYRNAISVNKKSVYKIRKTFISRLIHSGQIDIDTVCRVAGHVDMKTTFMSYCFSLDNKSTIQNKFENVLKIG